MKNKVTIFLVFAVLFLYVFSAKIVHCAINQEIKEEDIKNYIQIVYNARCKGLATGDWKELKKYYDISKKYAQWSYEHEAKRIKYLTDWSKKRGVKFKDIKSEIEIKRVKKEGDVYYISITEKNRFDYFYEDDANKQINSFEVFLRHSIGLVLKDDKLLITRDWYSDCFENALGSYSGSYIGMTEDNSAEDSQIFEIQEGYKQKYDRQKAIEYADKYYYKYNSKYKNCEGIGGDCTNFVSQCIGDKDEGGGIAFDRTWFCVYPKHGKAEGSKAFVNTDAFKNYLIYSGRGRAIKRGDFEEVTAITTDSIIGAVGYLQLGDLICYEKKGQIDHFSIIAAKDSKGYPMINSHTIERFHVPFDLGWQGKGIKFHLIRIMY